MISDDAFQISNYIEGLSEEYKINSQEEIIKDDLKILLNEEEIKDKMITNSIIKDDYIIMTSVKTKDPIDYENKNIKEISLTNFTIIIIKYDIKKDISKNQKIDINIPIKGEKIISKKSFYNQNYYSFDFISVNDTKKFLILYIFEQLHIFKIYIKDDKLKYTKIKMKNFSKLKIIYLGSYIRKNENILEIGLLLKPSNTFTFIPIDINDQNSKLDEKNYTIIKEKENILNKFIVRRSCFDKFILTDKNEYKNYIICKDDNKNEIIPKEIQFDKKLDDRISGKEFLYLYNIEGKMFLIAEIPKKKDESSNLNYLHFDIYQMISDKNKYRLGLIQTIKIKIEEGQDEYNINTHFPNIISIFIKKTIIFIHLDKKGSVDSINKFQLNLEDINVSKRDFEKSNELNIFLFLTDENSIYLSKVVDSFMKLGKCKLEFQKKDMDNNKEKEKEKEKEKKEITNIETTENNESNKIENIIENKNEIKNTNKVRKKKKKDKDDFQVENEEEEEENENDDKEYINQIIKETIVNRMEYNMRKIESIVEEKDEKLRIIKDDISLQNKEMETLENKIDNLLKHIKKLNEMKNDDNYDEEEEEEEEVNRYQKKYSKNNRNYNYKRNFSDNQNNINNKNIIKNNQINPNQINPNQINPNQINPNQINLNQINPNQINQNQINPNQIYPNQINPNQINQNQLNQINQINSFRQMNPQLQQQLLNQFNQPNQKILFIKNSQLPLNQSQQQIWMQMIQTQQQQQQRQLINQGNFNYQNKNRKKNNNQ